MRIRTLTILTFLIVLLPVGGCSLTSAERVAALEAGVTELRDRSAAADEVIDGLQSWLTESQAVLTDPNLADDDVEQIAAAVVAAQAKLEKVTTEKAKVDAALADLEAQLAQAGEVTDFGGELQVIGGAVGTVGGHLPPPFGTYAALAGGLIATIGTALRGNKKTKEAKTALAEVVAGGQEFKRRVSDQAAIAETFRAAMIDKQVSPATRKMVKEAKAERL